MLISEIHPVLPLTKEIEGSVACMRLLTISTQCLPESMDRTIE